MDQIGNATEVARLLEINRNTALGRARQAGPSAQRRQRPYPARQEYERLRTRAPTDRARSRGERAHRTGLGPQGTQVR